VHVRAHINSEDRKSLQKEMHFTASPPEKRIRITSMTFTLAMLCSKGQLNVSTFSVLLQHRHVDAQIVTEQHGMLLRYNSRALLMIRPESKLRFGSVIHVV
jgi:hypothetical protein